TALAVLAATTGRGLVVLIGHFLAQKSAGSGTGNSLGLLLDPFTWVFIIFGVVVTVHAFRLAGDARFILPPDVQDHAKGRKIWAAGLLTLSGAYAVALLGFIGVSRYEATSYLLQPGVDPEREQQALLAMHEGGELADQGKLDAAE